MDRSNHLYLGIPIQCRVATCQPYRVLANVVVRTWVVVTEPIIIQSRLRILILPLILERNERRRAFPLSPVDVQLLLPYFLAVLVVGLQGCAEVVGDDGETIAVGNQLGSRYERVLLEEPSHYVFFRLFRPFVQWHVAFAGEVCLPPAEKTFQARKLFSLQLSVLHKRQVH